jgi:8-oxo-dGTP pyrophosphatase MutT (NUDIX family)
MRQAAGAIVLAENTGRTLLMRRADGLGWSHPGGWSERGESPVATAMREVEEETGLPRSELVVHPTTLSPIGVSMDGAPLEDWGLNDVGAIALVYTVIVVTVRQEFVPTMDHEHTAWTWADVSDVGPHLHPGCALALEELGRGA